MRTKSVAAKIVTGTLAAWCFLITLGHAGDVPDAVAQGLDTDHKSLPAAGPLDAFSGDRGEDAAALSDLSPLPIAPRGRRLGGGWRIHFGFFTDPADADVHRATYMALSPEERATPVLSAERQLSRRHPLGWAETMVKNTCWDAGRNSYACPTRMIRSPGLRVTKFLPQSMV